MTDINRETLADELRRDEGCVPHAYQDSLGYLTIGVGRLIDKRRGGRLRADEIALMLDNDIADAIRQLQGFPAYEACDTDARRRALVNMVFQMGMRGVRTFERSMAFVAAQKWEEAAENLKKSLWFKQTPARAARVIEMIRSGE